MEKYIEQEDGLAKQIQSAAADLHRRLLQVDADEIGMPEHCLAYFKISHSKRLFFSIQTSAHLLYRSISMTGKMLTDLVVMDYGAGVGTLYLLAKMIGCKKVVYNDHLDDWKTSAELVAKAIGVEIDVYIVGDIADCLDKLEALQIRCDIITSRNVIEHIYKLDVFYKAIRERQPQALIFSSTTANKSNPAAVLKHALWHRKWEKVFREKRMKIIERNSNGLNSEALSRLASATRGMAADELMHAIKNFEVSGTLPDPSVHGSNTCDPQNGVWAEHLLSKEQYRKLIGEDRYEIQFAPGFWDTHYSKTYKNMAGKLLNRLMRQKGETAMKLAPFIYVIAKPR